MLCPACRRQLERGASWCGACGAAARAASGVVELVLADATRVPLEADVTLGREPGSTVVLSDPSVSRLHARISPGNGEGPLVEDAGSSHGTFLDGVRVTGPARLRDGARIRLGDSELAVERRRDAAEAGRTIVVRRPTAPSPPARRPGAAAACAPATRSSGWRRARAASAGCSRTSRAARSCA